MTPSSRFFTRISILTLLTVMISSPSWSGEIHTSARSGNTAKIGKLLKKNPDLLNEQDEEGRTALHIAVISGKQTVVTFLLKRNPDLQLRDADSRVPLDHAVLQKNYKMAELLLKSGADPNGGLKKGETPLHLALGDTRMINLLLANKASVDIPDETGATVLHLAVTAGDLPLIEKFLAQNPDIDARDGQLNTPLHRAALSGRIDITRLLLSAGASRDAGNAIFGLTPLHLAVRSGHLPVVRLLLDSGASMNKGDIGGTTPLHLAVTAGEIEIAELLLTRGATPGARDSSGNTPLHLSATSGQKGMTALLIARRAPVSAADTAGNTPLHLAIIEDRDASHRADEWDLQIRDRSQVVRLLLDARADVNARDHTGRTPLHWAALQGDRTLTELLISYGADLNAETRDDDELTPVSIALKFGQEDVAEYIRERGGDE